MDFWLHSFFPCTYLTIWWMSCRYCTSYSLESGLKHDIQWAMFLVNLRVRLSQHIFKVVCICLDIVFLTYFINIIILVWIYIIIFCSCSEECRRLSFADHQGNGNVLRKRQPIALSKWHFRDVNLGLLYRGSSHLCIAKLVTKTVLFLKMLI